MEIQKKNDASMQQTLLPDCNKSNKSPSEKGRKQSIGQSPSKNALKLSYHSFFTTPFAYYDKCARETSEESDEEELFKINRKMSEQNRKDKNFIKRFHSCNVQAAMNLVGNDGKYQIIIALIGIWCAFSSVAVTYGMSYLFVDPILYCTENPGTQIAQRCTLQSACELLPRNYLQKKVYTYYDIPFQSLSYHFYLQASEKNDTTMFEEICHRDFTSQKTYLNSGMLFTFNVSSVILIAFSDFYGRKTLIVLASFLINLMIFLFMVTENLYAKVLMYGVACGCADSIVSGFI